MSQAKVYLALIRGGPSKVTLISEETGIHRAHLYEILRSLQESGFVDRNLGNGAYSATSLKEVASILVKRKQQEIAQLEKEVNTIADYNPQKTTNYLVKPAVVLTSNKNLTLNRAQKFVETSQSQLESMHTWKRFSQSWQHFESTFVDAMDRGVMMREIVGLPVDIAQAQEFLERKTFKNKHVEVKFMLQTGGNFTIIDKKMLLMSTTQEKENLGETPFIFSNYEGLVGLMEGYFQLAWATATDVATLSKGRAATP